MSAGSKILRFTQSVASSEWTVAHNFGTKPACDVAVFHNNAMQKIFPSNVVHQNDNTVVITFSSPRTGTVTLIA